MAGRHRRPPAWRRILSSLVRSRDSARTAALQAEVVALRSLVVELRAELTVLRARATEPAPAVEETGPGWVTLQLPLVKLALDGREELARDPSVAAALRDPDRSPDAVPTEIVLEPTRAPADRLAWSVLAALPERPLLDPAADRDTEPRDPAADVDSAVAAVMRRRTA